MAQDMERSVEMNITITVGKDMVSERKFLLYPGTEMVYGQGVDFAVTQALATISKVAYDTVSGGDLPDGNMGIEVFLGKAMQDAQA